MAAAVSAGLSWAIEFLQLGEIPEVLRPVLRHARSTRPTCSGTP
ncbi:hypothetical protein [Nonomuraea rubra]